MLLLHVGCVVVGLVTTATAAATAGRLRRLLGSPLPLPEALRRYFRPGVNWAGRTVYGIPVFGFALLALSQGAYALGQGWVLGGLAVFAAVALLGEGVLWPAERRLQVALWRPAAIRPTPPGSRSTTTPRPWPRAAVAAWCCWWPGRSSWWRNPDAATRTGPPWEVPFCRALVGRLISRAGSAQLQPLPPPTGGGSL